MALKSILYSEHLLFIIALIEMKITLMNNSKTIFYLQNRALHIFGLEHLHRFKDMYTLILKRQYYIRI